MKLSCLEKLAIAVLAFTFTFANVAKAAVEIDCDEVSGPVTLGSDYTEYELIGDGPCNIDFTITGDGVTLDGWPICWGRANINGSIVVKGADVELYSFNISDPSGNAITLEYTSSYSYDRIEDVTITQSVTGISSQGRHVGVYSSSITNNLIGVSNVQSSTGGYLDVYQNSELNENTYYGSYDNGNSNYIGSWIHNSELDANWVGAVVVNCMYPSYKYNSISNNSYGIKIYSTTNGQIKNNTFSFNQKPIDKSGNTNLIIKDNIFN